MARGARSRFAVVFSRVRMPLAYLAVLFFVFDERLEVPLYVSAPVLVVVLMAVYRLGTPGGQAVRVGPPLEGRWAAVHSPADAVPSHGIHAYGQTYAIDLVDASEQEPAFGWRPVTRPPESFTSFGAPVHAVAEGTVVRVRHWQRDHRSRDSIPALVLFLMEAMLRELLGAMGAFGNHVVVDLGDGVHAVYGHLRRRSVRVSAGDRVAPGQVIAQCGNSGNSTQPHLHFQLQDISRMTFAAGVPLAFDATTDDDGKPLDLPSRSTPAGFAIGVGDADKTEEGPP